MSLDQPGTVKISLPSESTVTHASVTVPLVSMLKPSTIVSLYWTVSRKYFHTSVADPQDINRDRVPRVQS